MRPVLVPLDGGPTTAATSAPTSVLGLARASPAEPPASIARRAIGRVARATAGMLRW
jgi:hypothetical protein